ncbi:MAG: methyltransferase domain-containing protein [Zoogloeaceae bacterium]|nr:methyltransferase domain-containing protein [Zoogloeaceae bacterium]
MSGWEAGHDALAAPSPWVTRFAPLLPTGAAVLDYACGRGRHARWLALRGYRVEAVDQDPAAIAGLAGVTHLEGRVADLEAGVWPYAGQQYDGVVVTHYLYRRRLPSLLGLVRPGGVLIYETFMVGNERFGKPSNPDFLLRPGELLELVRGAWTVVAFEQGEVARPRPAMIQRLCAVKGLGAAVVLPGG